jgi:hypothetical protein
MLLSQLGINLLRIRMKLEYFVGITFGIRAKFEIWNLRAKPDENLT